MNELPRSIAPIAAFLARHSALIVLAVFAAAGAAVWDDYGVVHDTGWQRQIGYAAFNYILGDEGAALDADDHNRFYGVAFELPLIVAERALGPEDSRDIHLIRRLFAHAFFLAGGFFAWLLAYRLFDNRLIALLAMSLFLLHPRIYAHSFFNPKDVPFLSMFMIALYLTHRAFRRDSAWAFALCGAGVGALANFRIMGLMLLPAILGMLALDVFYAMKRGRGGVKHEIANICAFSTMFAAIFYVVWPLLWRDPMNLVEALGTLSQHPNRVITMFRGELVQWPNIPWDFIPAWALITTPPVALTLAALGIGYLARLCAARPRDALANSAARFGLLAVACLVTPVVVAAALNSNLYHGWRQMYFLYAPLCVLAAFGLRALADIPKPSFRAGAFALAALGIAAAAVQIVQIHPYQNLYFNALVDKKGLGERWDMDYWFVSHREALEAILEIQPAGRVALKDGEWQKAIIPRDERRRLHTNEVLPSHRISHRDEGDAAVWTREVYGVPFVSVLDVRAESEANVRAIYAEALSSAPDAVGGDFVIRADRDKIAYVKDDCGEEYPRGVFTLSIFPAEQDYGISKWARNAEQERQYFEFGFDILGAALDGKCVVIRNLALPDGYRMSHIETSQWLDGEGLWSAKIPYGGYHDKYRRALESLSGEPAIRSGFDVYMQDGVLAYVKESCEESDTRGRFFLSVFPVDPRDLPQASRDAGHEHEPLNFSFANGGEIFDGKCAIARALPDYPISRIETGQWIPGEGELWRGEIAVSGQ